MGGRIHVPMPHSQGFPGEHVRDKLVREYGEASVTRAETAVLTNIMISLGIIKQSDFLDELQRILKNVDERRRRQAGVE